MVIENVLDDKFCDDLVARFDKEDLTPIVNEWAFDYRSFSELNLSQHPQFTSESNVIMQKTYDMYNYYKQAIKSDFMPSKIGFEEARMKMYAKNDHDQFGFHADVGDHASARRFLAFFYYLNGVEEGGETVFVDNLHSDKCVKVIPKKGSVVIFPPFWNFPHKGMKPISNDKYAISCYAHYL